MQIDLSYFDGCPSWQSALENLQVALERENITAEIRLVRIEDNDQARISRFLGSPSFQVMGQDLWPDKRLNYHLSCRVYATPSEKKGSPSVDMLQERIRCV